MKHWLHIPNVFSEKLENMLGHHTAVCHLFNIPTTFDEKPVLYTKRLVAGTILVVQVGVASILATKEFLTKKT